MHRLTSVRNDGCFNAGTGSILEMLCSGFDKLPSQPFRAGAVAGPSS